MLLRFWLFFLVADGGTGAAATLENREEPALAERNRLCKLNK